MASMPLKHYDPIARGVAPWIELRFLIILDLPSVAVPLSP